MSAAADWQCLLTCPDLASAIPVADYLTLHKCPAFAVPLSPSFALTPTAAVLVPAEFLRRAHHVWAAANTLGDLTDGELEYLTTGRLPGAAPVTDQHDDAA
jgi:hypothetical protein